MRNKHTTGLRLTTEQTKKLKKLATRLKTTPTQLILWSIDALVDYAAKHDGKIVLPLDFDFHFNEVKKGAVSDPKGLLVKEAFRTQAVG